MPHRLCTTTVFVQISAVRLRRQFGDLVQQVCCGGTVGERFRPTLVADDAIAIDHECGGPVTDLGVNSHLHGNAVGGADGLRWVLQERISQIPRTKTNIFEESLG